jgi:2-haloacid dehalogenase
MVPPILTDPPGGAARPSGGPPDRLSSARTDREIGMDLTRYEALTFDCYGTLVDWERGILGALRPVLHRHGIACDDDWLLGLYGTAESGTQAGPWRPYREVLSSVMDRLGAELGFAPDADERDLLARSLPDWPVFPDTVAALTALAKRYRLAVVSNIDDDLFVQTARRLEIRWDAVVTAQQVRSYKPAPAHFRAVLDRLRLDAGRVLHVAQSLYHDVAPARSLGLATVWVNRRAGLPRSGATPPSEARADLEVFNLQALVTLAGL